jgi:hypothetical protein
MRLTVCVHCAFPLWQHIFKGPFLLDAALSCRAFSLPCGDLEGSLCGRCKASQVGMPSRMLVVYNVQLGSICTRGLGSVVDGPHDCVISAGVLCGCHTLTVQKRDTQIRYCNVCVQGLLPAHGDQRAHSAPLGIHIQGRVGTKLVRRRSNQVQPPLGPKPPSTHPLPPFQCR